MPIFFPVKHGDVYEEHVVTDNVHVAIGYAIANCIMVIAPEGLIIVDVTETVNASKEIFDDFRNISSKPIKAIIYTHYHHDHIMGAKVLQRKYKSGTPPSQGKNLNIIRVLERKYKSGTPPSQGNNLNIIRLLQRKYKSGNPSYQSNNVDINHGLQLTFTPTPHTDTFYFAFPNLYSIRGTPMRDPKLWYTSVQNIADLSPDYLVLSHHYPVEGKEKIQEYLIKYRDCYTVCTRSVDQLVELVKLPSMLANESYLQQCYGTVPWSSKACSSSILVGLAEIRDLFPMTYTEKAKRMQNLTGGINVSGNLELKFPPEYIHNFIYSFRMRQLTDIVRFKFQDTGLEVYLQLRNGVAIISDSQPKSDAIYEIVYANANLYREFVFSMSVGAGWPYDGGLPFGIELTPAIHNVLF
ncbi:hypothetical protein KUTeg_002716 [Tegillarca granosa]|uniref:Metallo-beta-lactamase domain-containing protein n=1 Tax=Tegillarca granosa TaxID=220873 RepID=A0ABQ9FR46_TEGGR|nr:hypothetical protein KUTeg_002716 [Tegillarca granosa]